MSVLHPECQLINNQAKYYLRSSILGGQVIAEIDQSGGWTKGFVYGAGGELLAIQENNAISFVHQDPVTKSQRITNGSGGVISGVDLDPWGGETNKSFNLGTHSRKYTTYERDLNGDDEAQQRKYKGSLMRFTQPDPFDGSASLYDPQSLNRYAYVGNDPVNFVDPSGLNQMPFVRTLCTSVSVDGERGDPFCRQIVVWEEVGGSGGGVYEPGGDDFIDREVAPTEPAPQQNNDPCPNKGQLDHFANSRTGMAHINERHIDQTPEWQRKKSYYTFGALTSTPTAKQTEVMRLNQEAFERGGAIPSYGNTTVYIYAPYLNVGIGPLSISIGGFIVGRDKEENFKFTNVRTVVVSNRDCKTVITSHPGLPQGVGASDSRIVGTPYWWDAINSGL